MPQVLPREVAEGEGIGDLIGAIERTAYEVRDWFTNAGPETWLVIGAGVLLFLFLVKRRR